MKRALEEDMQIVTIDAGGTLFKTTRVTLQNASRHFPHSVLAQLLTEEREDNCYFVDTDPKLFRHILQLLRRPSLGGETPQGVNADVWHTELDYWGLSECVLGEEERSSQAAARTFNRHWTALEQLGDEIRTQIRENEVSAVRTLLDQSGYSAARDKVRDVTLNVPIGKYAMECGSDLGHFLYTNASTLVPLFKRVLGQTTSIEIRKACHVKHFNDYEFGGHAYSTKDTPTLIISIHYKDSSINSTAL